MPVSPRDIREELLSTDAEFQRLAREHTQYEIQLKQISDTPYLSAEDILRQTTLKKLKLRVKDEMERIVARRWDGPPRR